MFFIKFKGATLNTLYFNNIIHYFWIVIAYTLIYLSIHSVRLLLGESLPLIFRSVGFLLLSIHSVLDCYVVAIGSLFSMFCYLLALRFD